MIDVHKNVLELIKNNGHTKINFCKLYGIDIGKLNNFFNIRMDKKEEYEFIAMIADRTNISLNEIFKNVDYQPKEVIRGTFTITGRMDVIKHEDGEYEFIQFANGDKKIKLIDMESSREVSDEEYEKM